jgi:hypothetical protein
MINIRMSRYKTLATEEDNSYISPFAASTIMQKAERTVSITPINPVAKLIPSNLQNTTYSVDSSSRYGPVSSKYSSLRVYGN